jgi:serine protease Do
MKKRLFTALPLAVLLLSFQVSKSQENKVESQEIIIQKRGDKDTHISVEIQGDQIMVNGKPLSEHNDKDITVKKKKMIIRDGNSVIYDSEENKDDSGPSSFFSKKGQKPFLGVSTEKDEKGARIAEVTKGSAAEKAGLQTGDIINKINDTKIDGPQSLIDAIGKLSAGDEVKIGYIREGKKTKTMTATLGARREEESNVLSFSSPDGSMRGFSFPNMGDWDPGSMFRDMPGFDFKVESPKKQKLGIKIQDTENDGGVKVLEVEEGSSGAAAGLRKDDIITGINGHKITNTDEARIELKESAEKSGYQITALRDGKEMKFEVKIPRKLKTADL